MRKYKQVVVYMEMLAVRQKNRFEMRKICKKIYDKLVSNQIPVINWFYQFVEYIDPLEDEDYLCSFGFSKINGQLILRDYDKLEKAFNRVWENRDFEIKILD